MQEPIIASLTDPDSGMVEHLMHAQLLINERDVYKRAWDLFDAERIKNGFPDGTSGFWIEEARKLLQSEKINSGKVC